MGRFSRCWAINGEAGRYCHMQLWNVGPSNLTFVAAGASLPTASTVTFLTCDAPLDHSLMDAGAGSDCGIDGGNNPSVYGRIRYRVDSQMAQGGQIYTKPCPANGHASFTECGGLVIPPNRGLMIRIPTLAVTLFGSFVWDE